MLLRKRSAWYRGSPTPTSAVVACEPVGLPLDAIVIFPQTNQTTGHYCPVMTSDFVSVEGISLASNDFAARYRGRMGCRGLHEIIGVAHDGDDEQDAPDSAQTDPHPSVRCGIRRRN
ncbi:hypothetical protein [Nocardia noduli]|uniref:hypothetical protein n=1 Tax=Nocardia noduli TaxID=2815722 RepID=UPI001C24ADE4|nr:hypothetical protein [Nocardia noduli]